MDKLAANTVHALKRANERYKVCLNKSDLDAMLQQITEHHRSRRCPSDKDSLRRKVWEVEYKECVYRIVVEDNKKAKRRCIVTFLPAIVGHERWTPVV